MPLVDQLGHVAKEKGQQQRGNVRAVDVGVGKDDYAVVAQVGEVKMLADAAAQCRDDGLHLSVLENAIQPGALGVEDLAAKREHSLKPAVTALLGAATRAVALDDEQLGPLGVALRAVGQLARQGQAFQCTLADHQIPRPLGCCPRARRGQTFPHDRLGCGGSLFQERAERLDDHRFDLTADLGVHQLDLGLALELRLGQLDADDRRQSLAGVVSPKVWIIVLEQALSAGIVVDRSRDRRAKAG